MLAVREHRCKYTRTGTQGSRFNRYRGQAPVNQAVVIGLKGLDGLITLLNFNLSGEYGYVIKLQGIHSWDHIRTQVMRAGGEILERWRQNRGQFNDDRYAEAPRDFRGLPIGETQKG